MNDVRMGAETESGWVQEKMMSLGQNKDSQKDKQVTGGQRIESP
jgi:hypothetical protein